MVLIQTQEAAVHPLLHSCYVHIALSRSNGILHYKHVFFLLNLSSLFLRSFQMAKLDVRG